MTQKELIKFLKNCQYKVNNKNFSTLTYFDFERKFKSIEISLSEEVCDVFQQIIDLIQYQEKQIKFLVKEKSKDISKLGYHYMIVDDIEKNKNKNGV